MLVSDLDLECRLWLKLRLAPMAPYIGSLSAAFVVPPTIRLQLLPYNRVRIMRIPILQARLPPASPGAARAPCIQDGILARLLSHITEHDFPDGVGRRFGHQHVQHMQQEAPICCIRQAVKAAPMQAFLTKLLTVDLPGLIVLPF